MTSAKTLASTTAKGPVPVIPRRRPRNMTPARMKDERYWQHRMKNNVAAQRSREARRLKEQEISMRAGYLEKQHVVLT